MTVAAQSDEHNPICPTHLAQVLVEGRPQVVGYASIGIVPMVFCWVHSKRVRARDSFTLLRQVEEAARVRAPAGIICTPCGFGSPFYKYMPKLGYNHCGDGGIFLKILAAGHRAAAPP